jgi:hypothetical protein
MKRKGMVTEVERKIRERLGRGGEREVVAR